MANNLIQSLATPPSLSPSIAKTRNQERDQDVSSKRAKITTLSTPTPTNTAITAITAPVIVALPEIKEKSELSFVTECGFQVPKLTQIGGFYWMVTKHLLRCRSQHADMFQRVFVTLVREALTKMHKQNVAHQDVRHSNLCFFSADNTTESLVAVLIDLDRVEVACEQYPALRPKFVGEMYQAGSTTENWTYAHQDMKQLAMLGLYHHAQDDEEKLECPCACCQELKVVKKSGKFTDASLFSRSIDPVGFNASLTQFYQALCCDNLLPVFD